MTRHEIEQKLEYLFEEQFQLDMKNEWTPRDEEKDEMINREIKQYMAMLHGGKIDDKYPAYEPEDED